MVFKKVRYICTIFSMTLPAVLRSEIGLEFVTRVWSSFLKTGETGFFFKVSGQTPFVN